MTIRFSEGVEFMPLADRPQPITFWDLCVDLGVARESDAVRSAAVREWLASNTPNVNLRRSISKSVLFDPDELRSLLIA